MSISKRAIVNRPRVSLRRGGVEPLQDGFATGRRWARESAEAGHLWGLASWNEAVGDDRIDEWFEARDGEERLPFEDLFFLICPLSDASEAAEAAFWVERFGEPIPRPIRSDWSERLKAFHEGAMSVWNLVKEDLLSPGMD